MGGRGIMKAKKFWSQSELDFLKEYYGKIKNNSIGEVLGRSKSAVFNQAARLNLELNARIYTRSLVDIEYKGNVYKCKAFRYERNDDKKIDRTYIPREKKEKPVKFDNKKVNPQKEKKIDLNHQGKVIGFTPPEGKKLVKLDNKTWAYR